MVVRKHHENVISNLDIGVRFYESIVTTSGYVPFHWHSSIELVCVMEGKLELQFDQQIHTILPHQFVLISSGVVHDVTNTPNRAFVLQVPLKFIEPYYQNPEKLKFNLAGHQKDIAYHRVVRWFDELNQIKNKKYEGYLFDCGTILLQILKTIVQNFTDDQQTTLPDSSNLKEVIIYINKYFASEIKVSVLAQMYGYNASYLSRMFKKQMGVTIVQYIYTIRLNNLYQDLIKTTLPINNLLDKNGLTNHRTAREMCKRVYGMLPLQIRKTYAENIDTIQDHKPIN